MRRRRRAPLPRRDPRRLPLRVRRASAHPSAAPLVQLAHARALREEWVSPREIEPIYLRLPDAQINWATRGRADERRSERAPMSVLARLLRARRRRRADRHRADAAQAPRRRCSPIEQDAYPQPWSRAVFESELEQVRVGEPVLHRRSPAPRRWSATPGCGSRPPRRRQAHVTNLAVAADAPAQRCRARAARRRSPRRRSTAAASR